MKRAAPYLFFALVAAAVFWKFLLFGHTMYAMSALEGQLGLPPQEPSGWFRSAYRHTRVSDNLIVLAGHLRIYNEGLKANEIRLWNPTLLCGLPTYADPMIHPFYPPNLILHRVFSPDTAYQLGTLLHLFFAGATMYRLLHGTGRGRFASTVGGLVWMLGGYHAMWFSTGILSGLMVFGPLALLALHQGIETRDRSRAGPAALAMGMAILGSHPQHAVLFFLFLLSGMGYSAFRAPETRAFTLRFGTLFALFSVGIGLAEILPRLDTIEHGYRDPQFDQLSLYAEPWRLLTYASGLIFGKVYFPGPGYESEFPLYAGLAAASLAVLGAIRSWNESRVRVAAVATVASIAVAFVWPLAWCFTKLPILNLSPASRCLFIAGFGVAYLAAHGVDALAIGAGRAPRAVGWVAVVFAMAVLAGIGPAGGTAVETAIGFGLAAAAAFTALRWKRAAAVIGMAALLFELLPPFIQFNYHSDSSLVSRVPDAVRAMKGTDPWRGTGVLGTAATSNQSEAWGNDLVAGNNLLALYGVENIGGFEAIIPRHYVAFADAAGDKISPAGRTLQFTRFDSPLIDALNLRYVLLPPSLPLPSRFRRIADFSTVSLYENRDVLPRARFATSVRIVRDAAEAEQILRDPAFDPRKQTSVLSDHPLPVSEGEITWKGRSSDRVTLDVNARAPGMLVLSDTDYPGWEATIDGKSTPLYRADLAFRAVEVPAGDHTVEFRFRPASARQGLWATLFFTILSGAAAVYRRKS